MNNLDDLLGALWNDYASMNKQAGDIFSLLEEKGEEAFNDHIAFRTFNHPKVGLDVLAQTFLNFGYEAKGEHEFKKKKLFAKHFEHKDEKYPLIFISELKLEEFSQELQDIVNKLIDQVDENKTKEHDFVVSGRLWTPIKHETYLKFKEESEYAAWMSVFGFRANHFTLLINRLKTFKDLQEFNQFLKSSGFKLNDSGGEIKGTPKDLLEQSSTLAYPVEVEFLDKKETVPACYYEFAHRYPMPDGKLFMGFIAQSADKIFESTDNKESFKNNLDN